MAFKARIVGRLRAMDREADWEVDGEAGREADRESGRIAIFIIGCMVFVLALVTVVISASAIHLERKQLLAAADSVALAAANAPVEDGYFGLGVDDTTVKPLSLGQAREAAVAHLNANPHLTVGLSDVEMIVTVTGGDTVHIHLRALSRPPLTSWITQLWSDGITINATAQSRTW